ncbi:MAG: hypothetical protein M1828_001506 [Chrysothrix sp. TS-e1954]|nr:MAG: hypothetical protein M1828_001506 [Chrysothrix sp. TS-e1954]
MSDTTQVRRVPYFFREENAGLIVKGNFMTLAAKPEIVEKGEWLAHQVVEQYRLLDGMLRIIQETDSKTKLPICNQQSCPTMSAVDTTYTWLDNAKQPRKIPAYQYIGLVQKWISGKMMDRRIFPIDAPIPYLGAPTSGSSSPSTSGASQPMSPSSMMSPQGSQEWLGKSSGFPQSFESDIRNLYRQMFRCYAHLYHAHWLLFYHMSAYKELNTCCIHFINVGRLWDLLSDRDMKPLQPLIDIWLGKSLIPREKPSDMQPAAQSQTKPAGTF